MIRSQWDKRSPLRDIGSKIFLDLYGTWGADLNTVATMMVTAQFMEMRVLLVWFQINASDDDPSDNPSLVQR